MKLLIIADDFTGALDTGVQLSKNSISTCVFVDAEHIPDTLPDSEVIVINANIRHAVPESAYNCVQNILKKLYFDGLYLYIKTDSVFRGNISAAFAGAMDFVKKPLFFVPAYPKLSRATKDATAYVNGELLENSVFANDPRSPVSQSNIPSIINKDYKIPVECIPFNNYDELKTDNIKNNSVYLFDCETDMQLNELGRLINRLNGYMFSAGCAGFAATFASNIVFSKNPAFVNKREYKPALFISGSANAVTFAQLQYAKKCKYPVFCLCNELNSYINNSTENSSFEEVYKNLTFQNLVNDACTNLQNNKSVIFATATAPDELLDFEILHKNGKFDEQIHNCIAEYTSNLVKSILEATPLTNIVVFGGDMVAAILQKLGIFQVTASGEITDGVPLCQIERDGKTINLITKSGGFGYETLIPVIENYFMKG